MKTWHIGKDPMKMWKQAVGFLEIDNPNRGSRKNKCPSARMYLRCLWLDKKTSM